MFILASGQGSPLDVAFDGQRAFWTVYGGPVASASLCGGAVTTIANEPATSIALDDTNVYWILDSSQTMELRRAPRDGGAATTLATSPLPDSLTNLVVDGDDIYYGSPSGVARVPKTGGPTAELLETTYAVEWALAVDATSIYFGSGTNGLMVMPKAGGTPTSLAPPIGPAIGSIVTDDDNVYFATTSSESVSNVDDWVIVSVPKAGGDATILVSDQPPVNMQMVLDLGFLKWTNVNMALESMPTSGGGPSQIASTAGSGLAAHDGTLVWSGYADGTIRVFAP